MPRARSGWDDGKVLILAPFVVPINVQFFTVTPFTFFSPGRFPKLPMLAIERREIKKYGQGMNMKLIIR